MAEEEKVGMDTPPEKGTLETDVPKTDTRETDVPEKYSRERHETKVGETRVSNSHGSNISVEAKNSNSPINK